jgi:hypothetical protein
LPAFQAIPGLVGISLNGGMSRGYADALSEVDVTLHLTDEAYRQWAECKLIIPAGIIVLDGQLYDIKVISLREEQTSDWSEVAIWDANYAQVLYDPTGAVAELYAKKRRTPSKGSVDGHLLEAWHHYWLAGNIWLSREDELQAHMVLNQAVESLVAALFAANREHLPYWKWQVHMSRTLDWQPESWVERLAEAMRFAEPTLAEAKRRQSVIHELWREIDRHERATRSPDFPLTSMQEYHYGLLHYLADQCEVTVADWQKRAQLSLLQQAPFYACVVVDAVAGRIRLDWERLNAVQPTEMYPWFYEVADAVRRGRSQPAVSHIALR